MLLKTFVQLFKRPKSKASAWDAAGSGKRLTYWQPGRSAINSLLGNHLETLRSRARDMVRKNPYASNIIETLVSNTIGTGIKPQSKAKNAEFRKAVQALWLRWSDEADSHGVHDFYGLQASICRSMIEGGECFVRFRVRRAENGLSLPLQLQALESEHLDTSVNRILSTGNMVRSGIDYKHLRPSQIRGEPWLSPVLLKLYALDQYDDAELVHKKTAAMFAGFITRLDPEANMMGEGAANQQGIALAGLEPCTMQLLETGEDVKFSNPSDVGANYEAFMRQQLRAIAIGMGITYEQLTGDLTNVNYSSIRAGLIGFRRRCATLQHHVMVFQFCRPVWNRWIELALLSGALPKICYETDDA